MKYQGPPLKSEFDAAHSILASAVDALQPFIQKRKKGTLQEETKPDGSIVTEADYALNELIVDALHRAFPDDAICAEEGSKHDDESRARRWFVDPIDGTRSFAAGIPGHAIMFGLSVEGRAVLGAIHDPTLDESYIGAHDLGVTLNGDAFQQTGEHPDVFVSGARKNERARLIGEQMGFASAFRTQSLGCQVIQILKANAAFARSMPRGPKFWDTLAPSALVLSAGGRATGEDGSALEFRGDPLRGHESWFTASLPAERHELHLERLNAWIRDHADR